MTRAVRSFVVLGFASTHSALDAEALLIDLGIDVVPIPTPKSLGSLCGIALRLAPEDRARAVGYLAGAGIDIEAIEEVEDV